MYHIHIWGKTTKYLRKIKKVKQPQYYYLSFLFFVKYGSTHAIFSYRREINKSVRKLVETKKELVRVMHSNNFRTVNFYWNCLESIHAHPIIESKYINENLIFQVNKFWHHLLSGYNIIFFCWTRAKIVVYTIYLTILDIDIRIFYICFTLN